MTWRYLTIPTNNAKATDNMTLFGFSFYDIKAQAFTTPFFLASRGQAVRAAIDLASDMSTTVGRHPADFHLNLVAVWDDQTGRIEPVAPESLGVVSSLLPQQPSFNLNAPER